MYVCTVRMYTLLRSKAGRDANDDDTPHAAALCRTSHSDRTTLHRHIIRVAIPCRMPVYMGSCRCLVRAWGKNVQMDATGPASEVLIVRERVIDRKSYTNKEKERKPSHVCAQPALPCSPAARASLSWALLFGWLAGWRLARLGRARGNTCETAIIMAFCLRVGVRGGRCVPQSRNTLPCDLQHNLFHCSEPTVSVGAIFVPFVQPCVVPRDRTSKMSPTHPISHSLPSLLRRIQLISRQSGSLI